MTINNLSEIIKVNNNFKNAINLYLNLNNIDKISSYIPTKSSVDVLKLYLNSIEKNENQSSILIGPYGKGKSHLLLVLLAIISLKRTSENDKIVNKIIASVNNVDETVSNAIRNIWKEKGRFLPVLISSTYGDLNQSFLIGLNESLKRENLIDLVPNTYFTYALNNINKWMNNYKETYNHFIEKLKEKNISYKEMVSRLLNYDSKALSIFKEIYPELTSGSIFNPLVNSEVLEIYQEIAQELSKKHGYSGIYVIFDEFSKFIESRDKTSVGNDMKLLQDICELSHNSKKSSQVFISFVAHKSIKEYGKYLSSDLINSFAGIEGRIEERYFVTSSKNNYELIKNAIFKDINEIKKISNCSKHLSDEISKSYYDIPAFRTTFKENDFKKIIVDGCYPLNPISSYLLLNVSEKVAQNERTLFTFMSKDEPHSMLRYIKNHNCMMQWVITPDLIYDYFKGIFKKNVANEYVHREWLKAEYAISSATTPNQVKILKIMALINIVNKPDELSTIEKYLYLASEIEDVNVVLDELLNSQIIYKKSTNDNYVFKTRIGTDLKNEINRRRIIKSDKINIGKVFSNIASNKYIIPKKYNQEFSITRYFRMEYLHYDEFMNIDDFSVLFDNENFCDGKVIALICTKEDQKKNKISIIEKLNKFSNEKIVIINPTKTFEMIKQVQDYEIIQELKNDTLFLDNNKVLKNELSIFEDDIINELLIYLNHAYDFQNGCKAFYYKNGQSIESKHINLNKLIDYVCFSYYRKTPVINNEQINRQFIKTAPIRRARKNIIEYILNGNDDKSFYEKTNPEATIYRSLFKNTGILNGKLSDNMREFLSNINASISLCIEKKISLSSIINNVVNAPFGIRGGVLSIYLAYILRNRTEDIIIYFDTKEVQLTSDIILNMCENPSDYFLFMSAQSAKKEKYIIGLLDTFSNGSVYNLSGSRINNILICMQRWFRALPQVTRNFRDKFITFEDEKAYQAMLVIKPLLQRVDANPYEIIFDKIPAAFGVNDDYEKCLNYIKQFKYILDNYLDYIINNAILETINIFKSKEDLYHTLKNWYDKQSSMSKKGIYSNQITNLMTCIANMTIYDDVEIVKKVIKSVTDVYIENWNDKSFEDYIYALSETKKGVESIKDETIEEKHELVFRNKEGKLVQRYYDKADENTGSILRNIIEDTIDDFSDLSVNDKVSILVEMLEKVLS
ncbi:hypothetical protein J2Z76_001124 [Sedimentibacter acidaminivorans]|uniref:Uncharacterized protein n=1 Tax=Sedimentibacter acidaminivorans TaxID=913099 RepID=A0ABS4GC58_9FIRM|nr:hypothetical protein [Sedimentibacter acidaminivorans]MBP1925267.1 hypothetical protein [Sedimentibacter acidaminivorans]